jgi:hypothetical protein
VKEVILSARELTVVYFHFLLSVKRLDLFLLHLVTQPELAVQSHLQECSPKKERSGLKYVSV